MDDTNTKSFQHFKFTLPILKTRTVIVKDEQGNDVEKRYVEGVASSTDLDLHGDRMDESAIKSMAESLKYHIIRLNAEHDTSWQSELGDISKLYVSDDNRLLIEAELNEMSKAQDLWYAITELNKKLGLSIGGYVKEYEMEKEEILNDESGELEPKWVRHYKNIELDHIAVTSSPANPKTWVGAIAKSIQEDSTLLAKKLEEVEDSSDDTAKSVSKERQMRDIARQIVKMVQAMEADLLLELTFAGLNILSEKQINLIDSLITERGANMKKDISLEADETLEVDTEPKPEGESVETPAALDNETEEETPSEEGAEVEEPTEAPAESDEEEAVEEVEESTEKNEEGGATEAPAEEAPAEEPVEGEAVEEIAEEVTEEPKPAEEASESDEEESEVSGLEDGEDSQEGNDEEADAPAEEAAADEAEEDPVDNVEEKSLADTAELLKSVQDLTGKMAEILKTNETLVERVKELESQPATRKTVEIEKGVGDENVEEEIDAKSLKEEMEEKIAEVRKNNFGSPNLFAMVQKIRAEYSNKVKEQN